MNNQPFCPIALVTSRFNAPITERLLEAALSRLKYHGFTRQQITSLHVPGALEIPITAQHLAETQRYQAIIALGCVIRGETSHYDLVCQQACAGCQQVSLNYNIPIIFGVLTTENFAQALSRSGGAKGNKGIEAVDAAMDMINCLAKLDSPLASS